MNDHALRKHKSWLLIDVNLNCELNARKSTNDGDIVFDALKAMSVDITVPLDWLVVCCCVFNHLSSRQAVVLIR